MTNDDGRRLELPAGYISRTDGLIVPAGRPLKVMLAGPIKIWWSEWGSARHHAYTQWRDEVCGALVSGGHLVYRPHRAWQGAWHEDAQRVNDKAIEVSDMMVVLTPPGVIAEGTDAEMRIAGRHGVPTVFVPPGDATMLAGLFAGRLGDDSVGAFAGAARPGADGNGAIQVDSPTEPPLKVSLVGPYETAGMGSAPAAGTYDRWRDAVRVALVSDGHLVYSPHRAWHGSWQDGAQPVNDLAVGISDVALVLTPAGVAVQEKERQVALARSCGVKVVTAPPSDDQALNSMRRTLATFREAMRAGGPSDHLGAVLG